MKSTKVSYSFGTMDVKTPKVPNSNYEGVPHSVDFIPPNPGLGFLKEVGGTVYGKLTYQSSYAITSLLDLPHRGWVENYITALLEDLTTGSGGLSEGVIKGFFSAEPSPVLTYNNSTGKFALDLDLSKYTNTPGFLTTETDPVFKAHEAYKFASNDKAKLDTMYNTWGDHRAIGYLTAVNLSNYAKITDLAPYALTQPWMSTAEAILLEVTNSKTNWNTAHGWGNHAGLYRPINWVPKWSDLTGTPPELDTFLIPGDTKESLITNSEGEFEWYKIKHSDVIAGDNQHLTSEQRTIAITPASNTEDGYLKKEDWNTFNNKLDSLTLGRLIEWDLSGLLALSEDVLPTDDTAVDSTHTLSAQKIYSLLQGEDADDSSYGQSFTLFIPSGSSLVDKLGGATKAPTGWTLSAVGGSNGDLEITHNLEKLPASISIYRQNGDSTKSKLEGAVAYGDAKSTTDDKKLILSSYANTLLATEIRLIF